MKISVQISKTWQERQYEPFNVQLGMETEVSDKAHSLAIDDAYHKIAEHLQNVAQEIYDRRRK